MHYSKKSIVSIILISMLSLSLISCGKTDEAAPEELPEGDEVIYTIGRLVPKGNKEYAAMEKGFNDALSDHLGDEHIYYVDATEDSDKTWEQQALFLINNKPDLIFTLGEEALSGAYMRTKTIPIVSSGVIDYAHALHISDSQWKGKSGANVAGTTCRPPIASQLSLLLENDPHVKGIGIFYCPEDHDSIYQNEILEGYLDEAGIPWKEFAVTEETKAGIFGEDLSEEGSGEAEDDDTEIIPEEDPEESETAEEEELPGSPILPDSVSAPSSREGMTLYTDPIGQMGDDMILNSVKSLRTPAQSALWTESTVISSYFIPAETSLSRDPAFTEYVKKLYSEKNKIVVSGDMAMAESTLLSLYVDPYDLGYSAGKMAYHILCDGKDPGDLKIIGTSEDDAVKLYNGKMAALKDLEFPKSYSEYNVFMRTYIPGTNTDRVDMTETEEE